MALHETGSNNPDGIEIKKQPKDPATGLPLDGIYSHPYYSVKDIVGVVVFLAVFSAVVFFVPDMGGYFLEANNFIPADPLKTPEHIAPVWYFTPYYAMLRAVPSFLGSQFWGVIVMGVAVMIFFALPWLDRGAVKSIRYRGGLYKVVARRVRRQLPGPGLPRRRSGHRLGPVPRGLAAAGNRRPRDRRRARADGRVLPVLPADAVVHGARQDEARSGPGDRMTNMSKVAALLAALLLAASGAAVGSGGADIRLEHSPVNRLDLESQQRGARTFVNYCLNCHTAKYMRYNRLTDLGLTEAQIRDNLMFATDKIGETMTVAMAPADGKAWFGVTPPDLSVEARVRGVDWLYNYFLGFYRDARRAERLEQPGLSERRDAARAGRARRERTGSSRRNSRTHEEAQAAALATNGIVVLAPGKNHTYIVKALAVDAPGTLSPVEYRAMVADLVNFLDFMSEPAKNKRLRLGLIVLLYLGVLFVFAYWLKREYWKDIH